MYRHAGAALLRAGTIRADTDLPAWPSLSGGADEQARQWRGWLERVWSQDRFAEAIEVASPVLARQVHKTLDGPGTEPRQTRRLGMSVARYILRMTDRATPFGLFAGVAPAMLGSGLMARCGDGHRAGAQPAAKWLAAVVTRLEACPELLTRLPVIASNVCFIRNGRLVAPAQQHVCGDGDDDGLAPPVEVSVRHTKAVAAVLRHARSPIVARDLVGKLAADFPQTPQPVIAGLVADLIRVRLLITSLRPPMTVTDPLKHVIRELTAADAATIPGIAALTDELHAICDGLAAHNSAPWPARGRGSRARLADRMRHVASTAEGPLTVDTRLDAEVVLPAAVVREAEAAAAALTRLTPHPYGLPAWQSYYAEFMERYGPGAVVPLVEILNAGTGLGFPATFRGSSRTLPEPPLSARDERLIAIACETVMAGHDEIALDDLVISHLAGDGRLKQVPPHAELFIQLHAASLAAVRRGEFRLVVTGVSRAAGATVGRFLHLLGQDDRDRFTQTYTGLAAIREGALAAQVSCPPVHTRSESVARAPAMLPHIISVAEYPGTDGRVIPLDDLAVSGDADGLYLVSLARGRPVEPTVFNAVEFRHFTHPIARFLCEITRARAAVYMPFSWGAASSLPFLPRLRHRRSVLAPSRWNLRAASLPGKNATWPAWKDSMTAWRQRFRLPAAVYLGDADNLLRLDLDQDVHLALLRAHLGRHQSATLFEAPNPSVFGWLDGRAHEIALPLTSTIPTVKSAPRTGSARARVIHRDHGQMPGRSPWVFAKLYGHPGHQTELLCKVPDLLAGWQTPPEWWYIRYRDPEAHLRLRVRLPDPGGYGHAVHLVGAWADRLRSHGLAGRMQLDTYHPETGRYGSGAAMAAAESVFAADSAAAIAQITRTAPGSPPTEAITAASLVRIAAAFTGGIADGMRWLASHIPRGTGAAPQSRLAHAETVRLASASGCDEALHTSPDGEQIRAAWCRRDRALAAYRDALLATGQADLRDCALASLLHMHHIRTAGIDPGGEQVCHRLARSAALGWLARAGESPR